MRKISLAILLLLSLTGAVDFAFTAKGPRSVLDFGASTSAVDNSAAFQACVNSGHPCFVPDGTWNICAQVTLPPAAVILGNNTNPDPGSSSAVLAQSSTIITCPNAGSFTNGQAFFALKDNDVFRGIAIYGLRFVGGAANVNCINALNAISPTIEDSALIHCYDGISRFSDGNVPGASQSFSASNGRHSLGQMLHRSSRL